MIEICEEGWRRGGSSVVWKWWISGMVGWHGRGCGHRCVSDPVC